MNSDGVNDEILVEFVNGHADIINTHPVSDFGPYFVVDFLYSSQAPGRKVMAIPMEYMSFLFAFLGLETKEYLT